MQEVEQRDRNGRPRLSQTNFRVPSSRSSYGNTPGWVEKATKDFLDSAGDTEIGIGIKKLPYTKPKLRESIKNRIMAGSKGGRPGQWSARKAQLLAQEYRRAGGGYRGKPGRAQRSLKKWTKERWTTADGKPANRKGKMTRYLPAAAWKRLTPAQRRATIAKKLSGDRQGRQFVPNTERAASVSRRIRSKTLGPTVEEVAKNPNAPQMFGDNFPNMEKEPREDKPKDKYSPDESKLRELDAAVYYGDDEPIKPFLRGNIEIDDRKPVEKQTGSFVVIDPIVVDGAGDDAGMFIIVPRVTKFGQLIDDETAKSQFEKTGDHLGKFKTSNEAQIYLDWLTDIEDDIAYRDKKKPITSVVSMEKIGESTSDGFESRRLAIRSTIKKLAEKYLTEKSIGPRLGALNSVQIYDPDAIDADNDGFVQDATPWMRPALPSSPIIAGLRSVKKSNTATQRAIRESQEFLNLVSQYEPDLTEMMKSLAAKKNSSLYLRGLRNRQKPVESLALKAQRLQHLFDNNLSDAITSMNDPLRYTFESDDLNKYTKDVLGVISALAKKGHVATLTNYWTSGDPYKGVNAMVQHPAGFFYEIQFHTPSSYRLKNKLTPLYQKYRDEKNVQKRQEIYDEMLKLSKGVSIPQDIGKFGEPLSRGSGRADFKPVRPGKLVPTPNRKNGKRITQGVESSRRRMMTEEEKARFQPLEIADDKKAKLQPGTTLVFANEYDEILRTELIGPQVARVRSVPGVKLYIDPNPDNQDEIDRTMRKWDEMFGPVSSSQRQARGRSQPNRDERSRNQPRQGSRNQPRQEDEDPLDRINRLVDEDRKRRGLESSRNDGMSSSQGTKWKGESLSREQVLAEMEGDADLSGANLSYLNLNDVDLDYANLSGANLYSADLTDASLAGVNLTEATLDGADLSSAHLLGADLSYASLNSTNLSFAELSNTDFSSANLYEADLRGAILLRSTMHDIDLDFANLMGADLYEADLSGANLENTNLRETNFLNADLSEARLSGADLFNANITGANITDADFTGADIRGIIADKKHVELRKIQKQQQQFGVQRPKGEGFVVRFENTAWNGRRPLDSEISTEAKRLGRLSGAYLAGVNLSGREMGMIDLSSTNLEMANLQDAELARAIFEGSNLKNANLSRANLKGAKFDGANLEEAILDMADLTDASLTGANLLYSSTYGTTFRRADLSGANLEDQRLRDTDFRGADLRKTNLRNADLSGANLEEADLRGADLTGAILDGANLTDANTQGAIGMSSQRSPEHSMAKSYFESVGDSQAMSDLSFNLLMDREQIRAAAFSYALPRVETLMNQGKTGEEIADELDLPLLGVAIIVQGIPQDGSNNIYGGEKLKSGRSKFKVLDGLFRAPRALLAEKPYADKPELLGIDIAESLGVDKTKAMSLLAQLTATHYAFTVSEFADIFDVDLATAVSSKYRANLSIEDAVDVALELNMSLKDFFDSPMSDAIPAVRVIKSLPGSEDILLDALREEVDKNIELGDNDTARELMSAIEHLSEKFDSNRAAEALVGTSQMDDDEWMNFAVLGEVSREIMSGGESGEAMLEDIIDRLSTDETIQDIADSYRTTTEDIATSVIGFGKLPDDETKAGMYVYRVLIPENPGLPESNTATHVQPMPNSKIVAKLLNTSEEHIAYLVREYAKDNDLPVEYLIEAFSYHGLNAPFVAKVLGVTMSEVFDLLIDEDIAYSERRLRKGFKRTGFDNLTRPMRLGRELEKLIDEDGYSIQDIAIMMDMDVSEVDKLIKDWQRALRDIRKGI